MGLLLQAIRCESYVHINQATLSSASDSDKDVHVPLLFEKGYKDTPKVLTSLVTLVWHLCRPQILPVSLHQTLIAGAYKEGVAAVCEGMWKKCPPVPSRSRGSSFTKYLVILYNTEGM